MSQQIQELINKIKAEGIQAADQKASEIEKQAKAKAEKIIEDAKSQAEQIIAEAKQDIKQMSDSASVSLKQASRDMLLELRKEIEMILDKIVAKEIKDTLTPEILSNILKEVIKSTLNAKTEEGNIIISLDKSNVDVLKNGFVAKLQKELKKPIEFESNEDIEKGFTISFDGGKSCYDFTSASLAEHISKYLNSQVAEIVKDSSTEQ